MTAITVPPLRVAIAIPKTIDQAVLLGDQPLPAVDALELSVTFENIGDREVAAPLDEIGTGLVVIYRTPGHPEVIDDAVPPPPHDGSLMRLKSGEMHVERLMLQPPADLFDDHSGLTTLEVCVRWRPEWLRLGNYVPGSVTWNAEIELCDKATVRATAG